jgi:hypothetical protein
MRRPRILITLLIAGTFLVFGLWADGLLEGNSIQNRSIPAIQPTFPFPTPITGQRNLLVIGVDKFQAKNPQLESIWMLSYFPESPQITFTPLYPASTPAALSGISDLLALFEINEQGVPSAAFLSALQEKSIWWSGYIVLDEIALIQMVDFIGGLIIGEHVIDGAAALGNIPFAQADQKAAYQAQNDFLQDICKQIIRTRPVKDLQIITSLIPDHIQTDINLSQTLREWQSFLEANVQLNCEFPLEHTSIQE